MAAPPLPDILPLPTRTSTNVDIGNGPPRADGPFRFPPFPPIPRFPFKFISSGCWLATYSPLNSTFTQYDGTIRFESNANGRTASGDLYQRPTFAIPRGPLGPTGPIVLPGLPPNPAAGIPIQARSRYRYYLRVTKIDEFFSVGNSFSLEIQMWRYSATSKKVFSFVKDDSDYSLEMTWMTAPAGYPSGAQYAEGDLTSIRTGAVVGRFKMGWLSEFYRKASVEIDTVSGSERPIANGLGQDWKGVFNTVGFDMNVKWSDTNIAEPSGDSWTEVEIHQAMVARRDTVDLDKEWAFYVLAVKNIDPNPDPVFGIMFDSDQTASDSNNVPREGCAISSHTTLPADARWGAESGKRFGKATPPYFRTTLHELGHAFGLIHNVVEADNSFMNRTMTILGKATAANPFDNIAKFMYADENLKQLRHWPDVFIRPGGVEFGFQSDTSPPITPDDTSIEVPGLDLTVEPLLSEVPLGAPVRINLILKNRGKEPISVPQDIGLKSHYTSGQVTDTSGATRSFRPFICYDKQESPKILEAGKSISTSLTLLRGGQGALFPNAGISDITVRVGWGIGDGLIEGYVTGSTTVMVTPPVGKSHAAAAHKLLTTPDTLLVLVLGGDHLKDGVSAVQQALGDGTLRSHFVSIEARRLACRCLKREADVEAAESLVNSDEVVMSASERGKLEKLGVKCNKRSKDGK